MRHTPTTARSSLSPGCATCYKKPSAHITSTIDKLTPKPSSPRKTPKSSWDCHVREGLKRGWNTKSTTMQPK
eukprot:3698521-Amphidinium_carterae.1